jgi:hypothetical protein
MENLINLFYCQHYMNQTLTSLIYDQCALDQRENLSRNQFNLIVDPSVMESKQKCFQSQSPFVNNPFKSIPSEYIDVESELNGLNRLNSKCNAKKYVRDTSAPKQLFLNNCQGESDLQTKYTRMKKTHNVEENDKDNEKISRANFYTQNLPSDEDYKKNRMENNTRINTENSLESLGHYRYTRFDQNTRESLKQFIQDKRQNAKWLYQ